MHVHMNQALPRNFILTVISYFTCTVSSHPPDISRCSSVGWYFTECTLILCPFITSLLSLTQHKIKIRQRDSSKRTIPILLFYSWKLNQMYNGVQFSLKVYFFGFCAEELNMLELGCFLGVFEIHYSKSACTFYVPFATRLWLRYSPLFI